MIAETIPETVRALPFLARGGYTVIDGLFDDRGLSLLREEASAARTTAVENRVAASDGTEWRGGSPARSFLSASGGTVQRGYYRTPGMLTYLRQIVGAAVEPSGGGGTFTYYARPGDFLALHRDVDTCDLALITCLEDNGNSAGRGGVLALYPGRIDEPLSAIRSTPTEGVVPVRVRPGQTIALLGGLIAHELLPVDAGQSRIVSLLCYRAIL